LQLLQRAIERQQSAFNAACVGRTFDVLFEKVGRRPGQIVGRSPYLQAVHVLAPATMIGEVAPVTITDLSANGLYGELVSEPTHDHLNLLLKRERGFERTKEASAVAHDTLGQ
jgi:tRNA-2-methylthio-N6-dimethylallyladenosine synthase